MGQPFGDGLCAHLIALSNQSAAANCAASAIFLIAVSLSSWVLDRRDQPDHKLLRRPGGERRRSNCAAAAAEIDGATCSTTPWSR